MSRPGMVAVLFVMLSVNVGMGRIAYFSDFETDGGDWTASGDWEHGVGTGFVGGFGSTEPLGGHSGDFVWGTVIGGDHTASLVSTLSQSFTFTGISDAVLTFYEWSDSGGTGFDMARVLLNGRLAYLSDGDSDNAWRQVTIDLGADNTEASVEIAFEFEATTVVERTGWYVDDVKIAIVPEPHLAGWWSGVALTCLLIRRRR